MGNPRRKRQLASRAYFEFLESRTLLSASVAGLDCPVSVGGAQLQVIQLDDPTAPPGFSQHPILLKIGSEVAQPLDAADTPDVNAQMQEIFQQIARWNQVRALPLTPVDVETPATPPRTLDMTDLSNVRKNQMRADDAWIVPLSRGNGVVEIQVGAIHDFRPGAQNNQYVAAALLFDSAGNTYSMQSCRFVDTGDGGYNIYVTMNVPDSAVLGDCDIEVCYAPSADGTDASGAGGIISFADPAHGPDDSTISDKVPAPVDPAPVTESAPVSDLSTTVAPVAEVAVPLTVSPAVSQDDALSATAAGSSASLAGDVNLAVTGVNAAGSVHQGGEGMRTTETQTRWPELTPQSHQTADDVLGESDLGSPLAQ